MRRQASLDLEGRDGALVEKSGTRTVSRVVTRELRKPGGGAASPHPIRPERPRLLGQGVKLVRKGAISLLHPLGGIIRA